MNILDRRLNRAMSGTRRINIIRKLLPSGRFALFLWPFLLAPLVVSQASADLSNDGPVHHDGHSVEPRSSEQITYSEWNHQSAGFIVLVLGGIAMFVQFSPAVTGHLRFIRWYWPAGWIALGVYLFIRSDPNNWPWGPIGFWETMTDLETGQHKLFSVLTVGLGFAEGLRLKRRRANATLSLVFPVLALLASIMLGIHSQVHVPNPSVYWQHMSLAGFGLVISLARLGDDHHWMEWPGWSYVWPSALMIFGGQLLLYTEG